MWTVWLLQGHPANEKLAAILILLRAPRLLGLPVVAAAAAFTSEVRWPLAAMPSCSGGSDELESFCRSRNKDTWNITTHYHLYSSKELQLLLHFWIEMFKYIVCQCTLLNSVRFATNWSGSRPVWIKTVFYHVVYISISRGVTGQDVEKFVSINLKKICHNRLLLNALL